MPLEVQQEDRKNIVKAQDKYKAQYDKNKYKTVHYKQGEIVFVKRNLEGTGQSTKLQSLYSGPIAITDILLSDTYKI